MSLPSFSSTATRLYLHWTMAGSQMTALRWRSQYGSRRCRVHRALFQITHPRLHPFIGPAHNHRVQSHPHKQASMWSHSQSLFPPLPLCVSFPRLVTPHPRSYRLFEGPGPEASSQRRRSATPHTNSSCAVIVVRLRSDVHPLSPSKVAQFCLIRVSRRHIRG